MFKEFTSCDRDLIKYIFPQIRKSHNLPIYEDDDLINFFVFDKSLTDKRFTIIYIQNAPVLLPFNNLNKCRYYNIYVFPCINDCFLHFTYSSRNSIKLTFIRNHKEWHTYSDGVHACIDGSDYEWLKNYIFTYIQQNSDCQISFNELDQYINKSLQLVKTKELLYRL